MKYTTSEVVFREIPSEITLAINISECPHRCKGCHSPELQTSVGDLLTEEALFGMIEKNRGITCVAFMGGDGDTGELFRLNSCIRDKYPDLKTAWYSGYDYNSIFFREISHSIYSFDYVKLGPYVEELGPIDKPGSNQVLMKRITSCCMQNITYMMRREHVV